MTRKWQHQDQQTNNFQFKICLIYRHPPCLAQTFLSGIYVKHHQCLHVTVHIACCIWRSDKTLLSHTKIHKDSQGQNRDRKRLLKMNSYLILIVWSKILICYIHEGHTRPTCVTRFERIRWGDELNIVKTIHLLFLLLTTTQDVFIF